MSEQQKQAVINFYSVSDEYGEFSNFAPYPIRLDDKLWPTSEHYFQAQKFQDDAHQEEVRNANPIFDFNIFSGEVVDAFVMGIQRFKKF